MTEAEESEQRTKEFRERSQTFIDALDVDDVIAHLLVTEGFSTVEDVAFVPIEELGSIEGFDESIAGELKDRAQRFLAEREEELMKRCKELGVSEELAAVPGLNTAMVVALGEAGIKTRDDLADLASDELIDKDQGALKAFGLSQDSANAIIMAARAHWFGDEATAGAAGAAPSGESAA